MGRKEDFERFLEEWNKMAERAKQESEQSTDTDLKSDESTLVENVPKDNHE